MRVVLFLLLTFPIVGYAARVFLDVKVVDEQGVGISNAVVSVSTQKMLMLGYGSEPHHYQWTSNRTDSTGATTVRFRCLTADFECHIEAPGYYHERKLNGRFSAICNGLFGMNFLQTRTNMTFRLRKKKNPIPMYTYPFYEIKLPGNIGTWGYDLKIGDWISPYGRGEVADFKLEACIKRGNAYYEGHGAIVFDSPGEGFYEKKKISSLEMHSVYEADTNAVFKSRKEFHVIRDEKDSSSNVCQRIIENDEYLVIRTRVKVDKEGNIAQANYSKIYGPIRFPLKRIYFEQTTFNPNMNDPNLESDSRRNLNKRYMGHGLP